MLRQLLVPVAGLGLGISRSHFATETYGQGKVRTYVNAVTGNFIAQEEGIRFVEAGGEMGLYFTYNHQVANLADKWHLSIKRLKAPLVQGKDVVLIEEDGAETIYSYSQKNQLYTSPKFGDGTPYIEYSSLDNAWVRYNIAKKTREYFNSDGLLFRRENMTGKATQYLYDDKTKLLKEVVCTRGRSYQLRRDKNFLSIYQVEQNNEKCLITYEFDDKGLLKSTETPDKIYKIIFSHEEGTGYLLKIDQSDKTNITIHYDHLSIDPSKTHPNYICYGDLRYNFSFSEEGILTLEDSSSSRIKKLYVDAATGQLTRFDQSIQYTYNKLFESTLYNYQDGQIAQMVEPNGGITKIEYVSGYDKILSYDRIHKITRPDGQISEFFYVQDVGFNQRYGKVDYLLGVDGKPSVPAAHFYIYDLHYDNSLPVGKPIHAFLRFEISPEGRVTEYIPDKDGNIGTVRCYLNAKYTQKIQIPLFPVGCIPMQNWVEKQNKQDVQITKFQYDDRGQILRTTRYANVDANGEGVKDDGMQTVDTQCDSYGNIRSELALQQKMNGKNIYANSTVQYDSVQRILHNIDALHTNIEQIAVNEYLNQSLQIKVTNSEGLVSIKQFQNLTNNRCGYLASEQSTGLDAQGKLLTRTTSYARWPTGEITLTTQPDGAKTYSFFDLKGNLTYTLSPTGRVTEENHSDNGRVVTTITYANLVDVAASISKPPAPQNPSPIFLRTQLEKIKDPTKDRFEYAIFDASGRARFMIDADGCVVETAYDSLDRIIAKISYDNVSVDKLTALKTGELITLPFDPLKDRCVRHIYDLDGLQTGEQDAAGYVTEFKRNAAGWVTERIVYDIKQPVVVAVVSIDALRPASSNKDAHTRYIHDHRGQVTLEINADGYATSKSYYPNGKVSQTRCHITKVSDEWMNNPIEMPKLVIDDNQDLVTSYQYDVLGREIIVSDNAGKAVSTSYDKMNRVQSKQTYDLAAEGKAINGDIFRGVQNRYDQFGQITHEANPFVVELLAKVDADNTQTTEQKQARKETIWQQYSTRHYYNIAGLRIATAARHHLLDKADHMTYFFHDDEQRPVIKVSVLEDQTTRIDEDTLNIFNEAEINRRYSQTLPIDVVARLNTGLTTAQIKAELVKIQDDQRDAITRKQYDNRGNSTSVIDPEGYATNKQFNAFKECSHETITVEKDRSKVEINHKFEARGLEIQTTKQAGDLTITVARKFENAYGKQTSIIDEGAAGVLRETKTDHDRLGRNVKVTDPTGVVVKKVEYDALNRPAVEMDALLQETTHSYNIKNRTHTITYPENSMKETVTNNIFNEKIAQKDAKDNTESFEHASDGQVTKYTDQLNNLISDEYNLSGWHVSHQNKRETKTDYIKNAAGETIKTLEDVVRLKLATNIKVNPLGQQIEEVNSKGVLIKYEPNKNGHITSSVIDPVTDKNAKGLGLRTDSGYNGLGEITKEIKSDAQHAEKFTTSYQQDGLGRATGQTLDPDGDLKLQSQKILNNANKIICRIDANGNETRIFYDKNDRKRFVINACGGISEREYDANGKICCKRQYEVGLAQVDLDKIKSATSTDDIEALVVGKRNIADSIERKFYDKNGNTRFNIDIVWNERKKQLEGIVSEKCYDLVGRHVKEIVYAEGIDVSNIQQLSTSDIANRVSKVTNVLHDVTTRYILDAAGQERFIIDAENFIIEQRFNPMGQVIEKVIYANRIADPETIVNLKPEQVLAKIRRNPLTDSVQYHIFDSLSRPMFVVSPEGAVSEYFHDQAGNVTCEHHYADRIPMPQKDYASLQVAVYKLAEQYEKNRNPNDRIMKKGYDAVDRLVNEIDAENNAESFELNPLGERVKLTDKNASDWLTTYDAAGRQENNLSVKTRVTNVIQDQNGALTANKNDMPAAVVANTTYDNLKNPTQIITAKGLPDERKVSSGYNKLNLLTSTIVENVAIDNGSALDPNNPLARPEINVTVTTRVVYNAKKSKIVEIDESGNPLFTIYDELKRPIYEVNAAGAIKRIDYDSSNKDIRVTQYSNKFLLDLKQFIETGIPRSVVELNLHPDATNDIVVEKIRNRRGELVKLRRGPLFEYAPESVNKGVRPIAALQVAYAETDYDYNALGMQVKEATKLDANRRSTHLTWTDRCGQKVAEVDALEVVDGVTWYRPSTFVNNTFGECEDERHYANKIKDPSHLSFADLQDALKAIQDDANDHHIQKQFDKNGLTIKETNKNEILHVPSVDAVNNPHLDEMRDDLVKSYKRTSTGKITSITHENGSVEYKIYDERDYLIAETGIPVTHPDLPLQVLVPLTIYGVNAHGEAIHITKYYSGTKPVDSKAGIPSPIDPNNPKDQHIYELQDNRGKVKVKQDGNGNLSFFSSSASKKPARQWHLMSNWNLNQVTEIIKFLDEKYFHQDELGETIGVEVRRNGVTTEQTWIKKDIFGRHIGEGLAPDLYHIIRKFDALDNAWFTNEEKGINTITLTDLSGKRTLQLRCASLDADKDLSQVGYAQLQTVLNWKEIEKTEIERDLAGRPIARTEPAEMEPDPDAVQVMPLNMFVEKTTANRTILSWPVPQETNISPQLFLQVAAAGNDKKIGPFNKEIIINKGRYLLDVTDLASDIYNYTILHIATDTSKQLYVSQGEIQFVTQHNDTSVNVVATIEDENQLILAGKVADLTEIVLYQNNVKLAIIPLQKNQTKVDLKDYPSGVYQIMPIKGQEDLPISFDVVIHTNKPSTQLLSSELEFDLSLKLVDTQFAVTWVCPEAFKDKQAKVRISFTADDDSDRMIEMMLLPGQNGELISLGEHVNEIVSVRLSLQIDPGEWINIYDEVSPANIQLNPDQSQTVLFEHKWLLYLSPGFDLYKSDVIHYLDTSMDLQRITKELTITSVIKDGFTVDVTDLSPGIYPFKWPNDANYTEENVLRVTRGGLVFPQALTLPPVATKKIQPLYTAKFDNFDNPIETTNSLGKIISKEFNHRNKQIKRIDPEVLNYYNDGSHARGRPVFINAFDRCGFAIGTIDQNGGVDLLMLNEAGATIKKVLPDGVASLTQFLDVFGCVYEHWDSRRKSWKHLFDKNNNITQTTTPMGKLITYMVDEHDRRIATTRSWNKGDRPECNGSETHKTNHDERGNVSAQIKPQIKPMCQITKFEWDRNHENTKQINPDNSGLIWNRNVFGDCYQHIILVNVDKPGNVEDLSYAFFLNQMKQVYHKTSTTRPNETNLRAVPHTFDNVTYGFDKKTHAPLNLKKLELYSVEEYPTPAMDVELVYRWGHLVKIIDHARNQVIDIVIDTEGDRLEVTIRQNGEIIRKMKVTYDELRRPVSQTDTLFELLTGYDPCNSQIMNRGILTIDGIQMPPIESWNKVDLARRTIVSDGVLTNGQIKISDGQGVELNYQESNAPGFRSTEKRRVGGKEIITGVKYNDDGLLANINGPNGSEDRFYGHADRPIVKHVKDSNGDMIFTTKENANGVAEHDTQKDTAHPKRSQPESVYTLDPALDLVKETFTNFHPEKGFFTQRLKFTYANFDTQKVSLIKGHRTRNNVKDLPDTQLEIKRHASGALNARRGRMAGEGELGVGQKEPINIYITTDDGMLLDTNRLSTAYLMSFRPPLGDKFRRYMTGVLNPYFHGVNGQLLAQYEVDLFKRSKGMTLKEYASIHMNTGNGMGVGINGGYSFAIKGEGDMSKLDITSAVQGVSTSYPPPAPSEYIVVGNETFGSIAQDMIGDSSLGWMIAKYNDMAVDAHLEQGERILIPSLMVARKSVGVAAPYYQFVNAVLGNVMGGPAISVGIPDDDNGASALIGMLVVGIAMIVAPYLAGAVFGVTTTASAAAATGATVSTGAAAMAATGVSAGLINASEQGLLMGMGVQKHFDLDSVLSTAMMAGLSPMIGVPGGFNPAEYASYMLKIGALNASEQLMEMAAGRQSQFDVKSMITAMASSAVSAAMNGSIVTNKFAQSVVNSATNNVIASVIAHRRIDVDTVMQQAVGSSVLAVARNKIEQDEQRLSMLQQQKPANYRTAYQAAKQASRGSTVDTKRSRPMPTRDDIVNAERWLEGSEHDAVFDKVSKGRLDTSPEGIAKARAGMTYQRPVKATEVVERRTVAAQQHAVIVRNNHGILNEQGRFMREVDGFNAGVEKYLAMPAAAVMLGTGMMLSAPVTVPLALAAAEMFGTASMMTMGVPAAEGILATEAIVVGGSVSGVYAASVASSRFSLFNMAPRAALRMQMGEEGVGGALDIPRGKAAKVNATFIERGKNAPYSDIVRPRELTLQNPHIFVRVHGDMNQARPWMMRADEVEGLTPAQIQDRFALPELPKYISEVKAPAGATIRVGRAAAQKDWGGAGGGMQYELLERLPISSYQNKMPLLEHSIALEYRAGPYPNWNSIMLRK